MRYRLGGRESTLRHGGSFSTQREARLRRDWLAGGIDVTYVMRYSTPKTRALF